VSHSLLVVVNGLGLFIVVVVVVIVVVFIHGGRFDGTRDKANKDHKPERVVLIQYVSANCW
jgi:hypothetical protein